MSQRNSSEKNATKSRKKQKGKRAANSPLNDTSDSSQTGFQAGGENVNKPPNIVASSPCLNRDLLVGTPTMDMAHNGSFMQQPPPGTPLQFSQGYYQGNVQTPIGTYQVSPQQQQQPMWSAAPPPWAAKLVEDIDIIKTKLNKIDSIERTVNLINMKISDLEVKVTNIDTRVTDCETTCTFISDQHDSNKKDLDSAKQTINNLKEKCTSMNENSKNLKTLNEKMVDIEARSMRDNLLFFGIGESESENCEELIKKLCVDTLEMPEANDFILDRTHRIGGNAQKKPRPIVAKFHSNRDREKVRTKSFEFANKLQTAKQRINVQWPKEIREARRDLYPIMQEEKSKGHNVRLVRDKLFINGREYVRRTNGED